MVRTHFGLYASLLDLVVDAVAVVIAASMRPARLDQLGDDAAALANVSRSAAPVIWASTLFAALARQAWVAGLSWIHARPMSASVIGVGGAQAENGSHSLRLIDGGRPDRCAFAAQARYCARMPFRKPHRPRGEIANAGSSRFAARVAQGDNNMNLSTATNTVETTPISKNRISLAESEATGP